ncbi:MAG: hypothetical protein ACI4EQ_02275 [Lachnospiraceae bacterium]
MISSTIRNAVKLQVLDNQWQQKKSNFSEKKPLSEMTDEERMLANFKEQAEQERESTKYADIYNKLKSGGKLTSEEIAYLEEHDPEALQRYKADQAEKAAYERALKNCKTKDEVERVKMNKLSGFAAQAKKITTDPYIPLDKKVELMNQLNNKLCLISEAHLKFQESQAYRDMPTESELQEERIVETTEEIAVETIEEVTKEPIEEGTEDTKIDQINVTPKEETERQDSFEKVSNDIRDFVISESARHYSINVSV